MIDKKSWKVILDMAKAGDPTAMVEAGDYFADGYEDTTEGIIVKQDEKKAFKMYYNAAALMDTEGISRMALCLSEGIGCKQDIDGAIVVYKQALEMGDSIAAYNLGTIYRDQGKYKKAFKHYKVAMQLDHADYSFKVGLCYYYGIGTDVNKEKALKHFKKVAKDKNKFHTPYEIDESNLYLGFIYLEGEVAKRSLKKAKKYFERANEVNEHETAREMLLLLGELDG